MNKVRIVEQMPPMLFGEELDKVLAVYPEYDPAIIHAEAGKRMLGLDSLYDLFIPGQMAREIYAKLYMVLYRSLSKKDSQIAVRQAYSNFRKLHGLGGFSGSSVIGGADCMAIIGEAGIGKSRTIQRCVEAMDGGKVITMAKPFRKLIPVISVQTPFDSSVGKFSKGFKILKIETAL